jgi:serine phosphatase RsbU (regulator of sigma subunit)/HAMP domain-containing protein
VRATFVVGVLTILAAVVVAIFSTYNLSADKATTRDLLALQVVEDRVESSLQKVVSVSDEVGGRLAVTSDVDATALEVEEVLQSRATLFESAYITRANSSVVASLSPQPEARIRSLSAFTAARRGVDGFFHIDPADGSKRELWFTRAGIRKGGTSYLFIADVKTEFLDSLLLVIERSLPGRAVIVLEEGKLLAAGGEGAKLDLAGARWTSTGPTTGRVMARLGTAALVQGHYTDLQGLPGVNWRVVIVEPAGIAVQETLRAVAPSIAVLSLGVLVALAASWVMSRRLVRPLHELERAARNAAAGSIVKPLAVGGDDELGRVAGAFNLVALKLNALQDLSQLLASASELELVLERTLSAMGHIVGPGASAIYLLEGSKMLVPVRTRGIDMAAAEPIDITHGGWLADTLKTADPVDITASVERLAEELPGLHGSHTGALAAPLVAGSDPLGVVVVLRSSTDAVTDAEREIVRTFSAQAAVAVNTSRLFIKERDSRRIAEALRSVAEALVRPDDLDSALRAVEDIVRTALGASLVSIVPLDAPAVGLTDQPPTDREMDILDVARYSQVTSAGAPSVLGRGDLSSAARILDEYDGRSLIVSPIAMHAEYGAALAAVMHGEPIRDAIDVTRAFADEVALALENAYFYERAVKRAANLETIFRISQAVGSSLQVKVVLNRVLDVVQKILAADAVALLSFDSRKQELTTAMARGSVPASVLHLNVGPGEDLPGRVFSTTQPVAVRDLHASMKGVAGAAADNDLRSLLAVPLLARGRSIGVLMVFSASAGAFDAEDMNVLQTFASQAALALDTARLYSREHDVATILQQSIIPDALPDLPELTASSVYQPAGADTDIGGDYYDLIRGKDGSVWLSIADVCGKGIHAATKTTMIKFAVRAFVAAGLSPSAVVSEVNRMTTESDSPSDIVTLWVGAYDSDTESLSWANGGHPPGLIRRRNGEVEQLSTTGPLLGAALDANYDEMKTTLCAGDSLVLFTDGVTEARRGKTFYGDERVREFLLENHASPTFSADLLADVREFVSGELRDDVAILYITIRARPEPEHGAEQL